MIDHVWLARTIGKQSPMTEIAVAESTVAGSMGGDDVTTFRTWECTRPFPPLGTRLGPTAKLVFHVGNAFVEYERVDNSIPPECQFYGVPNAQKTISNLEVVSPKERMINCILKFYLCLFGPGAFVHYKPLGSLRKQCPCTPIILGPRFILRLTKPVGR